MGKYWLALWAVWVSVDFYPHLPLPPPPPNLASFLKNWGKKPGRAERGKNGESFMHVYIECPPPLIVQRFSRAGPRGREWDTLGVHPLSWLLSNNRLEEVCSTLTKDTFSSRLLLSNQVKGCSPSVAHSLPLGPALLNLSNMYWVYQLESVTDSFGPSTWSRVPAVVCKFRSLYINSNVNHLL